jgi:hypothetical protein
MSCRYYAPDKNGHAFVRADWEFTCHACPVQAEGFIHSQDGSKPFYFRSRGRRWSLGIGGEPVMEPEWFHQENYGADYEAGWITLEEASAFILQAIKRYDAFLVTHVE